MGMANRSIYLTLPMTRAEAEARLTESCEKLAALNNAMADVDTQSATISAAGGSKSYTNRSVADLERKIAAVQRDVEALQWRLGKSATPPGAKIKTIVPNYCV